MKKGRGIQNISMILLLKYMIQKEKKIMKENEDVKVVKRGPGRPRKNPVQETEQIQKRKPGRPRKNDVDSANQIEKKKPGRPKKIEIQIDGQMNLFNDVEAVSDELIVQGLASISKQVKESAVKVTDAEARFLVDTYYQVQQMRISSANQVRSIVQGADDNDKKIPLALQWTFENMVNQERQIKKMLDYYTDNRAVGRWLKSITGIGPVLAAGLLSNFSLDRAPHYGNFISYAGLNDYNNPWLGTEGAKRTVKEVYADLAKSDEELLSKYNIDMEKFDEACRNVRKEMKKKPIIMDALYDLIAENGFEDIYSMHEGESENPEMFEDFVIRSFVEPNAVTDYVIMQTAVKTNRTFAVVKNGVNSTFEFDKKKPVCALKTHLEKYLAKPPYSKAAKQLVYLIGESFVKVSGKDKSLYGRLYVERKAYETANNEAGKYADQAAQILEDKNYGKDTESYKAYIEGKLPAAQIHRRSKRYACRILLSHMWRAMYVDKYGKEPEEEIYPIAHLQHVDYIEPEVGYNMIYEFNNH